MLTTPDTIRTLPRKLYPKAKPEPASRCYALYDKLSRAEVLAHAWRLGRAKRGRPGVDGLSCEAREGGSGIATVLRQLAQDLKDQTYRAQPVRRVRIPKADGSRRPLGIPPIRDRVAPMAVKLSRAPIFEADFWPNSYGFRPRKSAHAAVDDIANALWAGYPQVLDAARSQYCDRIPPAQLMAVVAERSGDGSILPLLNLWLKAPVLGADEKGGGRTGGGGKSKRKGTPQGGVISPLLANCCLHLLDRIWQRHHLNDKRQAPLVRAADDFVVLCRREVQEPLHVVRRILERLDLSLTEAQTHLVDATQASFNFLGVSSRMSRGLRTGKPYPQGCPADKALREITTKLTALTGQELTPSP